MLRERLQRRLGAVQTPTRALKTTLLFAVLGAVAFGVAYYGRNPDLAHVKSRFCPGTERGNYYAVVQKMAVEAKRHRGRIDNIATAGSVENIARLAAGKASCSVQFALVQDGMSWPPDDAFELIGRLPRSESFVLVGRNADAIRTVQDLRGKRIGIGPAGSGTDYVARSVLTQLDGLDIKMSAHPLVEQLALVESGELDLAAMVIDKDAQLVVEAVRDRNLQVVDMPGAEALANRLPFAHAGRIEEGHYDPTRQLPSMDKHIIQIDTLVISNGCARESATQGVIAVLAYVFPDFVRVNRERPQPHGSSAGIRREQLLQRRRPRSGGRRMCRGSSTSCRRRAGCSSRLRYRCCLARRPSSIVFAFGASTRNALASRTRLPACSDCTPPWMISPRWRPEDARAGPETGARIDALIAELGVLAQRCRRQSLSFMVPMGQEMGYRYQETLIGRSRACPQNFSSRNANASSGRRGRWGAGIEP